MGQSSHSLQQHPAEEAEQNPPHATCSAAVGAKSWFLFSKASLNALSSAAGFTRGKAISHCNGIRCQN